MEDVETGLGEDPFCACAVDEDAGDGSGGEVKSAGVEEGEGPGCLVERVGIGWGVELVSEDAVELLGVSVGERQGGGGSWVGEREDDGGRGRRGEDAEEHRENGVWSECAASSIEFWLRVWVWVRVGECKLNILATRDQELEREGESAGWTGTASQAVSQLTAQETCRQRRRGGLSRFFSIHLARYI